MTNANNFCSCLGHVISIILKVYFYHYLNRSIYKEKQYTGSRYLIIRTSILYFVFDSLIFDIKTFSQYIIKTSKIWIKKKNTSSWYLMIRTLMLYFELFYNFCLWSQHHNMFLCECIFCIFIKKDIFPCWVYLPSYIYHNEI